MRPIIGDSSVPHITSSIIGIRGILAVCAIIEGIVRHLQLYIACSEEVEELFRMSVNIPGSGRKAEPGERKAGALSQPSRFSYF